MSAKTHLDVSLFTLGANDMIGKFSSVGFDPEVVMAEAKAVAQRYPSKVPTKFRFPFSMTELLKASGVQATNLNVTVFAVDTEDVLFRLRGGNLNIDMITDEVSGEADPWESEVACGTDFGLESTHRVDLNPAYLQTILDGDPTGIPVSVQIALGSFAGTFPMNLEKAGLAIDVNKAQVERCTMSGNGAPTSVSGNPLLVSILTGTGAFAYACKTATGASASFAGMSGNCLLKSTRVAFEGSSIQSAQHGFVNYGTPTVNRAS